MVYRRAADSRSSRSADLKEIGEWQGAGGAPAKQEDESGKRARTEAGIKPASVIHHRRI